MNPLRLNPLIATVAALALGGPTAADAQDERLTIHGFGYQDYRQSSSNSYLGADRRGTWDNNFLGLVLTGTINDRSQVWAQLQASSTEQARFTWVFVDYRISDALRAHVGRVKFPFGIYNEFIDTKSLQLSVVEPSAYSGPADMGYDAYNGAGLDYELGLGAAGRLTLQGFFGNIYNPPPSTTSPPFGNPIDDKIEPHNDRRIFGGKLAWETPVDGLRLLLSANRAAVESTALKPTLGKMVQEDRWIASVDFTRGDLDLKAEYNRHAFPGIDGFPGVTNHAWYLQAGYGFGNWTPYIRYDTAVTDNTRSSDPSFFQNTWLTGVNFKLSRNLNLRGEVHFNHGYALPVVAGETAQGTGSTDWKMLAVSINFMF
jgi:hypothetical protein